MLSLYRTLSVRYLGRRWFRAILIVASIALGVATLVATQALSQTMSRAGLSATNPLAGAADLLVSNGDAPINRDLGDELAGIPGVRAVHPRIFENVHLPDLQDRSVLLLGIDLKAEMSARDSPLWKVTFHEDVDLLAVFKGLSPVVVGKELEQSLPDKGKSLRVQALAQKEPVTLTRVGIVDAHGPAAALGGNVLVLELTSAASLVGLKKNQANRLDLVLDPAADRGKLKQAVEQVLAGRAEVRTPEEQNLMVQSVLVGIQTGFSLFGLSALVVGLFLVYNALSVSVTERRHEIGILLSVGATRGQVRRLFAGEAALLGLAGGLCGIPLGVALAYLGLQPVRDVVSGVFMSVEAEQVEVSVGLMILAVLTGILTAVAAALVPAVVASGENPADAVRRVPQTPTWGHRLVQCATAALLIVAGVVVILLRTCLPARVGAYGGMVLVLLGCLLATPLLAALAARLLQPLVRQILGIEGRLAADNLVRAPARTGLVIAALAAGVALFLQTAGIIRSNRDALRTWVQESIGADLIVTSGSPVGAGAQSRPMELALGKRIEKLPGVNRALPLRFRKLGYQEKQVFMIVLDAGAYYQVDKDRRVSGAELYRDLDEQPGAAIVSENFSALHGIDKGDRITLKSPAGEVTLRVLGKLVDYSWNHGTVIISRRDYLKYWDDHRIDVFDVYLRPGADGTRVQESILRQFGAEHGLVVQSRGELQSYIDDLIERLYSVAYGQQFVVMAVAALGVVTALLISVLQRRREMGLLRAIGASQAQVVWTVLAEAALMGLIGTAIGLLVGVPLEWYVLQVVILEESGYLFAVHIPWTEALVIAGAALVVATVAGLGPALYAVRQRIPEAIAYE